MKDPLISNYLDPASNLARWQQIVHHLSKNCFSLTHHHYFLNEWNWSASIYFMRQY